MTRSACRQLVPLLLLLGSARAMSDGATAAAAPTFSQSPADLVLRVTWRGARTLRTWSRSFFGDGRVEAADIGFDGKAVDRTGEWSVDEERWAAALSAAVNGRLTTSSQQQMLASIRSTGRPADSAEDEISLTVELRFSRSVTPEGARSEEVRVYRTRDPLGMARRFPEVPELAALAKLFDFARNSQPQ